MGSLMSSSNSCQAVVPATKDTENRTCHENQHTVIILKTEPVNLEEPRADNRCNQRRPVKAQTD